MDIYFDKTGRDRTIMDCLKRRPEHYNYPRLYEYVLVRRNAGYEALNQLIFAAFEAGISFSRATKRDAREPDKMEEFDE